MMRRRSLLWTVALYMVLVFGAESLVVTFAIARTRNQVLTDHYTGQLELMEDVGELAACDVDPTGWSLPDRGRGLIVPLGATGDPLNGTLQLEDLSQAVREARPGRPVQLEFEGLGISQVHVLDRSGPCRTFLLTPPGATIARGAPFLRVLITRFVTASGSVMLLVWLIAWPLIRRIRALVRDTEAVVSNGFEGQVEAGRDELGQLAHAFNQATGTAREKLDAETYQQEMLHQLFADLSHDIRTPLASMKLSVGQLIGGHDPSTVGRNLRAELEHLDAMFVNMATVARMRSTILPIRLRSFEVNAIMERLEARFGVLAADEGLALHLSLPEQRLVGLIDPLTLEQALGNVVHNAIKYARATVALLLFADDEYIVIQVLDDGPGPDPDELPHLTRRRFRGSTQGARTGTGLGLAITEEIVERHAGALHIAPHHEGGTRVEIRLPRS